MTQDQDADHIADAGNMMPDPQQDALAVLTEVARKQGWREIDPDAHCWRTALAAMEAAVEAERAACARVAEDGASAVYPTDTANRRQLATARDIATAIRERTSV